MRPSFRLFVDFDGTVSVEDSTDELLERFAEPEWETAENEWLAGRIGSRECLRRQVDALRLRPEALHAFVGSVEIDPGFRDFVETARAFSVPIAIVSDGLDVVIQGVLRAAGVSLPVFANKLSWRGGDRWSLAFPYAGERCASEAGHCKCRSLAIDSAGAVLVGDGRSDRCAAASADFVFAKAGLLDHCRAEGIPHERFEGFEDLTPRFARFAANRFALPSRTGAGRRGRTGGPAVRIVVVDVDGSLCGQPRLHELMEQDRATKVAARDLAPRLRIVASRAAANELRDRLALVWPKEPPLIFYGSGDFHHLCAVFLSFLREPVTVIQFDNHPDWTSFPKTLNCGSWVNRALELPHVRKVVTIGPAADDFVRPERKHANLQAIRDGRLEVHPWRAAPSRLKGAAVDAPGCRSGNGEIVWDQLADRDFASFVDELDWRLSDGALWVTIDKDVLGPDEAVTNWDQSELTLDMIADAVRLLGKRRRILGIDVCGDYSRPRYRDPFRLFLSATDHPRKTRPADGGVPVNSRTNERILEAFGCLAA